MLHSLSDPREQVLADLKGLKLRLPSSPVLQKTWETWGAAAYPIAWSETFTAIRQGVADAYESPLDTLLMPGFYPYTNRVTENLTYTPQCFFLLVNDRWFKKTIAGASGISAQGGGAK